LNQSEDTTSRAVRQLARQLNQLSHLAEDERTEYVREWSALGPAAIVPTITLLESQELPYDSYYYACLALAQIQTKEAHEALLAFHLRERERNGNNHRSSCALGALAQHTNDIESLIPHLFASLINEYDELEWHIANVLESLDFPIIWETIDQWLSSGTEQQQQIAIQLLGGSPLPQATERLLQQLQSPKPERRERAADKLHWHKRTNCAEPLLNQLAREEVEYVRVAIIRALGYLEYEEAFEPLATILTSANELQEAQGTAALALADIDPKRALPIIVERLDNAIFHEALSDSLASDLGYALSRCGSPAAPFLFDFIGRTEGQEQNRLANAYRSLHSEGISELINQLDKTHYVYFREWSIKLLGMIQHPDCIPPLVSVLIDDDDPLQEMAAKRIVQHGTQTWEVLSAHQHHPSPIARQCILKILYKNRHLSFDTDALLQQLDDPNPELSQLAVSICLQHNIDSNKARILALSHPDKDTKQLAFTQLKQQNHDAILPELIRELFEGSNILRANCAQLLGEIGGPEAEHALLAAKDDPEASVRTAAFKGLGAMGNLEAPNLLIDELKTDDWTRKADITKALVSMGEIVIAPLLDAFPASDPNTQIKIIEALGKLEASQASDLFIQLLFTGTPALQKKATTYLPKIELELDPHEFIATLRSLLGEKPTEQTQNAVMTLIAHLPDDEEMDFLREYTKNHIQQSWPKESSVRMMRKWKKWERNR
jgi:HEAT repeat protein